MADYFQIPAANLRGAGRCREVAFARQVGMYLCKKLIPGASLVNIGRAFGNRHHTTVLHACRKLEAEMQRSASLKSTLDELIRRLQ